MGKGWVWARSPWVKRCHVAATSHDLASQRFLLCTAQTVAKNVAGKQQHKQEPTVARAIAPPAACAAPVAAQHTSRCFEEEDEGMGAGGARTGVGRTTCVSMATSGWTGLEGRLEVGDVHMFA